MTEPDGPAWRQTIFHPFAHASRYGRGRVLQVNADSPERPTGRYGTVPQLAATAVLTESTGEITVFAVNRAQTDPLPLTADLTADLRGVRANAVAAHLVLTGDDPGARNTVDRPDTIVPEEARGAAAVRDHTLHAELPPLSWNVIRLVPS